MNKKLAFSMIELLIVIVILGVMATVITLNAKSTGQTAKKEAEKIAELLRRHITRADKIHGSFTATISENNIEIEGKTYSASQGCSYEGGNISYPNTRPNVRILLVDKEKNVTTGDSSVKITDKDRNKYWVVLRYDES